MKKISIVMAYHNRKQQLLTTLQTIQHTNHQNFEVIIVDDASSDNERLEDVVQSYPFKIILIRINKEEKTHRNPCIPYNIGFKHASGDIVIIQNPECCHIGDVISYVDDKLKEDEYFTFTCFSLPSFEQNENLNNTLFKIHQHTDTSNFWSSDKYTQLYNKYLFSNVLGNEIGQWYNHETYCPCNLHFLSAIHKHQLNKLGGFDERYKDGIAFEDAAFELRIRHQLKLNVKLVKMEENDTYHLCIHQYHRPTDYANNMVYYNNNSKIYEDDINTLKQ